MDNHFVASVILRNKRGDYYMIYHPTIREWMFPGGHLKAGETPSEAARREMLEETGIKINLINCGKFQYKDATSCSMEIPYAIMQELIEARTELGHPERHVHTDFIFLAEKEDERIVISEHLYRKWMNIEEIHKNCNIANVISLVEQIENDYCELTLNSTPK